MPQAERAGLFKAFNSVPVILMLLAILLGAIPFAAAVSLYALHSRAERHEAEVNASKTAALLLRSFEQSIEPIDSLLINFASAYNPDWTPQQTYEVLKGYNLPNSIIQLVVVDKDGMMVASSLAAPSEKRLDLSDREHIRVHMKRNSAHGDLFISKPILGRVSKTWTIQLTRPLDDGTGHFGGVVVASYLIADFINFYSQLRVEDDMAIALIGRDGIVRAQAARQTSFGDDLSQFPAFKDALGKKQMAYEGKSPLDGIERIGWVIQSDRYPIMVVVAYSLDYIREQTEDFRAAIWGTALGLFAALLLLLLVGGRYVGLQKRLNAREVEAVARQREANVLDAISRVPGISVMHVTPDGASLVGASPAGPFSTMVGKFLRTGRFRALSAGLKAPVVSNEHLTDGANKLEVEVVVAPLSGMADPDHANTRKDPELVVFAMDQTTRRIEENKLYQMSKLASLGEVATGLAHEINQPLGVIRLAAANARAGMQKGLPPEHLAAKLERIIQQTVRMSRIIDHMRIFGRKSDDHIEPCSPKLAVEGALQVVGAHFRLDMIEVTTSFADETPQLLCRQDQLEQVIINLLQNARDAIMERRSKEGEDQPGRITVTVAPEPETKSVRIDVADTAGGIPAEVIDRVFQPFFTTKPPGKGTGLGLSVSFGIIRDHGGSLGVVNGPDGAIFTIRLPAFPGVAAPADAAAADMAPQAKAS